MATTCPRSCASQSLKVISAASTYAWHWRMCSRCKRSICSARIKCGDLRLAKTKSRSNRRISLGYSGISLGYSGPNRRISLGYSKSEHSVANCGSTAAPTSGIGSSNANAPHNWHCRQSRLHLREAAIAAAPSCANLLEPAATIRDLDLWHSQSAPRLRTHMHMHTHAHTLPQMTRAVWTAVWDNLFYQARSIFNHSD